MHTLSLPRSASRPAIRRAGWLLAALATAAPVFAAPDWDMVGIRLGMTEAEARAALDTHAANAQLTERTLHFTFSDGAKQQHSPDFLAGFDARVPSSGQDSEVIQLEFSPPPQVQRVIRVRRVLTTYADPPPLERMQAQITHKFGRATAQRSHGIGSITHVASWGESGKPICGHRGAGQPVILPPVSQSPDTLRWYQTQQQQQRAPQNAAGCSAVLQISLTTRAGGSSVVTMDFEMNDPSHTVPALQATSTWLAGLEEAARKARLSSGATPKL